MVFPLILGAIAAAGSALTAAVSTIGAAVSSFVATVGPTVAAVIETTKTGAAVISQLATTLLRNLSILSPMETIEHLGELALQAATKGIKLENSASFADYMTKLRAFDLDPDNSDQRSSAEKLLAGLGVGTACVENKFNAERGSLNGMWLLPLVNAEYFTPERMGDLVSACRLGGDVLAYLDKKLSGGQAQSFEESLEVGANGQTLDKNERSALYAALDTAQENWAALVKEIETNR